MGWQSHLTYTLHNPGNTSEQGGNNVTRWRSAIDEMPECDPDHPYYPVGYDEWLEKVMAEP